MSFFQSGEGEREKELQIRLNEVRKQLEEEQKQLQAERRERAASEKQLEMIRKRTVDLQEQIEAQKLKKQQALQKQEPGMLACLSGICNAGSSARLQDLARSEVQLKQLQENLAASRLAAEKMKASREEMEFRAEFESRSVSASSNTSGSFRAMPLSGHKRSLFFRAQTPAKQREMKGHIQELLKELEKIEEAKEDEKDKRWQAEQEALNREATASAFEVQLRAYQRSDLGVEEQLKAIATAEKAKSRQLATSFKTQFRQETPARQREMRQRLGSYVKDLETLEENHLQAVKWTTSQRNSDTSQNPVNSFAWGSPSTSQRNSDTSQVNSFAWGGPSPRVRSR